LPERAAARRRRGRHRPAGDRSGLRLVPERGVRVAEPEPEQPRRRWRRRERRAVLRRVPLRRHPAPGLRGAVGRPTTERPGQPAGLSVPAEGAVMKARRLVFGGAAAVLTAFALFLGGALRGSPSARSAPVAPNAPAAQTTAAQVAKLQGELRTNGDDVTALDGLGLAYQQRARETGDP